MLLLPEITPSNRPMPLKTPTSEASSTVDLMITAKTVFLQIMGIIADPTIVSMLLA